MSTIHQILTSLTALVMTLSAQVGNLSQLVSLRSQLAQVVQTPATYDNSANAFCDNSGTLCTNGTTLTYPLTIGSNPDRQLAVFAFIGCNTGETAPAVSSVTYAGVALNQTVGVNPNPARRGYLYTLPSGTQPNTGTNNVVVTLASSLAGCNNGNGDTLSSGAVSAYNVDQTSPYASSPLNNSGSGTSATLTGFTSGANDLGIGSLCAGDGIISTTETSRWSSINTSSSCGSNAGATVVGGDTSFSWTIPSDSWIIIGGAFKATPSDPSAPVISSFTASPTSVTQGNSSTLSWSVSGNPTPTFSIDNGIGTISGSSISISPSVTTTYTLTATNSQGNANAQTTVTVTAPPPPDTTASSIPTNLSATAISSSAINLSWIASTDNVGVTGYRIYRGGVQVGTSVTNSYSDTGLSASTNYSYTVSAYDAAGNNSAQSSSASATTQAVQSGTTITATSCSQPDVLNAINSVQDGGTVLVPAGNCTWTSGISMTLSKSLTIQGAGAISSTNGGAGTTGSDVTTILDRHPSAGHNLFNFNVSAGKRVRITGLKIMMDGSSVTTQNGVISISGGSNSLRIDHNHFVINPDSSMTIAVWGGVTGVIDHNYFDSAVGNGPFAVYLQNGVGTGDAAWSAPDDFGTDKFLFVEDNRWRNGYLGDANTGGQRFIYRYNTGVFEHDDSVKTSGYNANHGITPGRGRSSRAFEYYGNNFSALAPGLNKSPFPINGGVGLIWGNIVTQYRYITGVNYTRKDSATYTYSSPPTSWGNCNGTTGTVWDGSGSPGKYPCLDQPGRGQGDLLSGSFPNVINTRTGNPAYVQQALSPIYVWGNTLNPAGYSPTPIVDASAPSAIFQANRDFYQQFGTNGESGSFNGTRGVGQGPLSARSSTCTAGPGGNTPGVGYWATDQNTLYVCTATNTWIAYYTPYTYPHPLQGGTPPPPPPPPPTAYTITSSAGSGGTISPSGTITLNSGSSQTFTFTPNTGYRVSNVIVNGNSYGSVSSYTFNNVTTNQSISVSFSLVTPIVGDFNSDGLVNSIDLSLMISSWNTSNSAYDLNRDGLVNSLDYTIMVQNWTL